MKKAYAMILIAVAVASSSAVFFLSGSRAFSVSSRFEGKTIKKIEFVAVRKISGGKEEVVKFNNVDGQSLIASENRKNAINKNNKSEITYDVIDTEEPLRSDRVRDTIKLLFSEGKLSDVRVEVQEFGDGVVVRFFCEELPLVSKIEFKGLDKVMETELKEKVLLKEGEPYRRDLMEKSLPAIKKQYFEKGLFNCVLDYKIDTDPDKTDGSIKVTVIIDEGEDVKIAKVSILGANQIHDYELRTFIETKEKKMLDDGNYKQEVFEQDKQKVIAYYKQNGFLNAEIINDPNQIEYNWENPDDTGSAVRAVYITLKIREGERYYFDGYEVKGITGTIGDKENDEFITTDKALASFGLKKRNASDPSERLGVLIGTSSNMDTVLDNTLLEKDRYNLGMEYAHYGHLNARITPTFVERVEDRDVNGRIEKRKFRKYTFTVSEGTPSRIEKIYIRGCKKTKEKVVRREVLLKEESNGHAELFDSYKMQMTRERIFNLGFFKEVNIDIRPGSAEDKVNVIIDVQEQPTGTISLGGSWASQSGFSIFADLGEKNLMGTGRSVHLKVSYGPTVMSTTVGFTEPWLMDYPIAFSSSVFFSRRNWTDSNSIFPNSSESAYYTRQTYGYSLGLAYRFWYFFTTGINWTHSWKNIIDADGSCSDTIFIEKSLGIQVKREISTYINYDSRNNYLNPTKGLRATFEVGMIGGVLLRGDDHFMRYSPGIECFYSPFNIPFTENYPIVLEFRASATFLAPPFMRNRVARMQSQERNPWLESDDFLYVGGAGLQGTGILRGWEWGDTSFPDSWNHGLFHQVLYGAELRIPIQPQYLWTAFFFDAGSLWGDSFWDRHQTDEVESMFAKDKASGKMYDIDQFSKVKLMPYFRYSWGFGFKIQIPMMPLRFWFGQKLLWSGTNHGYFKSISGFNFQFSIGDMVF
jgi:outer membrane protein insertion porin family